MGALIFIMLNDSEAKTLHSWFPPFDKGDLYWASVYKLARINLITCFLIPGDKGDLWKFHNLVDLADINMDYDIRQLPATVMDCFTGVLMSLTGWWGVGSRQ